MISDKTFTPEEFHENVKKFAQAFIDRINNVDTSVELRQEAPNAYLLTVVKKHGSEHYSMFLNNDSRVETMSVYNV